MNFKPKPIMFIIFCDFDEKLKTRSRAFASGRILTTRKQAFQGPTFSQGNQKKKEGGKNTRTNVTSWRKKRAVPLIPSGHLTFGSLVVKRYFEVYDGEKESARILFLTREKKSLFSI